MSMRILIVLFAIVSQGGLRCASAQSNVVVPVYDRPLQTFHVKQEPALRAILLLASEARTPLGIIEVDDGLCRTRVDIAAEGQTPLRIVSTLISQVPGYDSSLSNGVITVRPRNMPATVLNLLNIEISHYAAPEGTLDSQRALLWMHMRAAIDPGAGAAVTVPFSLNAPRFPTIDMWNATVEHILNQLVSRSPGGAWVLFPIPALSDLRNDASYIGAFPYSDGTPAALQQLSCDKPIPSVSTSK